MILKDSASFYKIIPETAVVPEFKHRWFKNYPGWNKQQLIKLAAAEIVETDFYLTLDADIICIRPTSFSDIVKDGRSYCWRYNLEEFEKHKQSWLVSAQTPITTSSVKNSQMFISSVSFFQINSIKSNQKKA